MTTYEMQQATSYIASRTFITVEEAAVYRRLLTMAHGDTALAERLIRYEARRSPDAPRHTLIQDAIERWVRDLNFK